MITVMSTTTNTPTTITAIAQTGKGVLTAGRMDKMFTNVVYIMFS